MNPEGQTVFCKTLTVFPMFNQLALFCFERYNFTSKDLTA